MTTHSIPARRRAPRCGVAPRVHSSSLEVFGEVDPPPEIVMLGELDIHSRSERGGRSSRRNCTLARRTTSLLLAMQGSRAARYRRSDRPRDPRRDRGRTGVLARGRLATSTGARRVPRSACSAAACAPLADSQAAAFHALVTGNARRLGILVLHDPDAPLAERPASIASAPFMALRDSDDAIPGVSIEPPSASICRPRSPSSALGSHAFSAVTIARSTYARRPSPKAAPCAPRSRPRAVLASHSSTVSWPARHVSRDAPASPCTRARRRAG